MAAELSKRARVRLGRSRLAAVVVTAILVAGCGLVSDGTESYRPPAADVVPFADCGAPDIVHRLQFGRNTSADNIPREGSLPSGFEPSRAVVCQLFEATDGSGSIDAVSLGGNVASFAEAINRPSERPDGNTTYSCATPHVEAPAAVYLVSSAGAVRMRWPYVICGLRDDPLRPLESLAVISRSRVTEIERLVPFQCLPAANIAFSRTSGPDSASLWPRRPTVGLPERDVMGLTACTYRVATAPTGDISSALTARMRLSAAASARLMRAVLTAPAAPPCDREATEVVSAQLFRHDGSGGGRLQVETDGCRRAVVDGFLGHRVASGEVTEILRGAP